MKLEELLPFEEIVIQCHDDPDADAVASGFALLEYLRSQGKNARLVYAGSRPITKSNLLLMIQMLQIPLEYVQSLDHAPALLITADCQDGQGNVSYLPRQALAVIDHHQVADLEKLPLLQEVRSSYGACSTVVWDLLQQAGFSFHRRLSTALYYGLYMDTNRFQDLSHPMDKDLRDGLKIDRDALLRLQNANLSLEEIGIAGQALADLHCNADHRFAVAEVQPCDPNILGVVSDMLLEVDAVDVCVAYCMLSGGVKFSVRSCLPEIRADGLAQWLAKSLGSGGGHLTKAGGFLSRDSLEEACADRGWDGLSGAAGRLIYSRMTGYFEDRIVLRAGEYQPEPDMALYRKKKVVVGYAPAEEIFPVGTEILIRMLEGDATLEVTPGLCVMIGVDGEIYPNKMENLRRNYELLPGSYDIESEYPPTVYDTATGEAKLLAACARRCAAKETALIRAKRLDCRAKVYAQWDPDNPMLGEAGDWLACRAEDPNDIYIIKRSIFEKTYEKQEE